MSLLRLRARRGLALVGLVLLGSLFAGELVDPHVDPHGDPGCGPGLLAHDSSAHHVRPAGPAPGAHPEHCFVCHWVRAFSSALPSGERVRADASGVEHLYTSLVLPRGRFGFSLVPVRAPPV